MPHGKRKQLSKSQREDAGKFRTFLKARKRSQHLITAIQRSDRVQVACLVEAGVLADFKDSDGKSLLLHADQQRDERIKQMIRSLPGTK